MDTAIEKIETDSYKIIEHTIDIYVQRWIDKGFYDLSLEAFYRDYVQPLYGNGMFEVEDACERIKDSYNEIVMSQAQKEEYRRLRKAGRGRWVGGGFGVGGAIKGAATAGVINAAGGLGHGVANAIGNLGTSIATAGKKRKLYDNPQTLKSLLDALWNDLLNVRSANINFAEKRTSLRYRRLYTNESEKAAAIIQNIKDKEISQDVFEGIIDQLFELNPYNIEFYKLLLLKYGAHKYQLNEMAEFFSCGQALNEIKTDMLEELYSKADKETLEDYEKLLGELENRATYYGISSDNSILKEVRDKYNELELEARTFEGVVFTSIEVAEQAKKEKSELDTIFNEINFTCEDSLQNGMIRIEAYNAEAYSKDGYLQQIKDGLDKVIYESEEKKLKEILQYANPLNKESLISVEKRLRDIEFKMVDKKPYIENVAESIKNFEYNIRKVEGILYDTVEEADKARKEILTYKEIVNSIDLNEQNSIRNALDTLKTFKFVYINPQKYIGQVCI